MHNTPELDEEHGRVFLHAVDGRRWTRGQAMSAAAWLKRGMSVATSACAAASTTGGPLLAVAARDRYTMAQWVMAGLLAGATVVPFNPEMPAEQIRALLSAVDGHGWLVSERADLADTGLMLVDPGHVLDARQEAASRKDVEGRLMVFTSGTTGRPKGVLLQASQLRANAGMAIEAFGFDAGWTTASVLPLFHTFTILSDVLTMWLCQGQCVVTEGLAPAALSQSVDLFARHGVMSFSAVPIVLSTLARFADRAKLASVRFAIAGAAPLPEPVRTRYEASTGHPILPCYGMSESVCFIGLSRPGAVRAGSVGQVGAGTDLRILSDGEGPGEIAIRGASVIAQGYIGLDEEANRACYQDGFLLTGDIGRLDSEGYLYVTGRKKNMLIKGGEKYYLEDIDRLLLQQHGLADCASLLVMREGRDDDYVTFIVPAANDQAWCTDALRQTVVGHFGARAAPSRIEAIEAIPRSATGKVQMALLAERIKA